MSASGPGPAALELRGWGWRHAGRRRWAVRGVDLRVAPGERVLLVGPSGAGKSTLLAGVAGLLDPTGAAGREGVALLDGEPAGERRSRVGMLFQDPESALVMARAGDDVAFGLENRRVAPELIWPRVDAALEAVGFPYGRARATAALSGGEQQRLALAGAIAAGPSLLLLDEPTANLDPAGTELVREAVRRVLDATGATLLLVEHRVDEALALVDRVVVLEAGGGVAADGPPAPLLRDHARAAPLPRRDHARAASQVLSGIGLVLSRPGRPRLLDGLDVTLAAGEATAVTGPNGVGKSTLALVLAGLLAPDRGSVRLLDSPARPLHRWRASELCRRVGTVFQDPEHQFLTGTVREELMLGPRRAGLAPADARGRVDGLLQRLHLDGLADANPFTLSGGEKRRLSVATALATRPDVLVLDEPTFGQDERTWAELLDLCREVRDAGVAVLTVTHDEPFAAALADRRLHMEPEPDATPVGAAR